MFRMNRNPKLRISLAHCSWTFLGIVVSLLFTATVARSGEAAGHRRLAVAYPAVTGSFAPFFIARELGLYTKHGLDIELVLAAGSGKVTLLLIGGSSPIVIGSGTSTLRANLSGSDLVIVAGVNNKVGFSLFTGPKIRSWEDFRGKTLGVTAIGSSSDIALRYILKQQGLIPGKDLRILATGGHRETLAAIKQELVAGGMITVLFKPIARAEGYREHIDLSTSGLELQTSALVTTRRFAEAESEVVRRFLSSFIEAVHAYKTRKNEAKGIIAKYARVTDSEALEQNYVYYFGIFKELPVPTLAGLKVEQEMIAETDSKAREYDLRRAIDPTFLQQIEASGFIRKLYGGER